MGKIEQKPELPVVSKGARPLRPPAVARSLAGRSEHVFEPEGRVVLVPPGFTATAGSPRRCGGASSKQLATRTGIDIATCHSDMLALVCSS